MIMNDYMYNLHLNLKSSTGLLRGSMVHDGKARRNKCFLNWSFEQGSRVVTEDIARNRS